MNILTKLGFGACVVFGVLSGGYYLTDLRANEAARLAVEAFSGQGPWAQWIQGPSALSPVDPRAQWTSALWPLYKESLQVLRDGCRGCEGRGR